MTQLVKNLNYKFTVATIAGFLISSLVFLGLFLTFYQSELEEERSQAAREVNNLLQSSLENAMLKRDLEGLAFIVNRLGQQDNINGVMIVNTQGLIRFSNNSEYINTILDGELIQLRHRNTNFRHNDQGEEVLRSINPVHNKPQCRECHGSMDKNPVNGILVVDYDASSIRQKVRNTTLILMSAGALIVIINLIGGWWFIRRFILQSVKDLSNASHSLARGQLDVRVNIPGNDELSMLGESFNLMADNLQSSMRDLEEEQIFLQAMVDAIPDGLRIIDDDFNMLLVNQTFREQTGCAGKLWVGEKCYLATQNRDTPCAAELMTCSLTEVKKTGKPFKVIRHHTQCDGHTLDVEIYSAPMTIIKDGVEKMLLVESIRDLKQDVRFTHEQRLTELGRLAANVAHEIYNPLSSMKLALNSLKVKCDDNRQSHGEKERHSPEIGDYLNIAAKSMDQCIDMTERLLRLSATPLGQRELVDIHQALIDIISLVKWDAEKSAIEVIEVFPRQPLRVFSSESEMRMLFLNLVQNAFHAMPSGGILKITGTAVEKQVIIRFEDNGIGMSKQDMKSIFMPFFSRRADNVHGTGLGLPISQSIAKSCEGSLQVESELDKGSCFILKIPEASLERLKQCNE
ncbi:MAG: HAMP domain-containing protein [gamma proteobacterium symbiont of Taylorina sp.]|nr:HAMP domain-containing protein [gamma proteobacterium symbiont of Taylorina sp.]